MTTISGAEGLLLETLGLPFFGICAERGEGRCAKRLQGEESLSQDQKNSLAELVGFLGSIQHSDPFSISHSLAALGEHQASLGMSW